MISYRYHPDEDWDIGKVSDYSKREHARNWQAAQRAPSMVATQTENSTPLPPTSLRPKAPRNDTENSKPTAMSQRIPLAQQRAAYEELVEIYTKDSYCENTSRNKQLRPCWEDRGITTSPNRTPEIHRQLLDSTPTLVESSGLGGSSKVDADIPEELFPAATGSSQKCDSKWLPYRAPNEHISGFYLLEETGPELYHVLGADETGPATEQPMSTAIPATAAPRYLMHVRTKKTFAFRPEGLSVMQSLRQRAKKIQVLS
jgi:hypothetical protein